MSLEYLNHNGRLCRVPLSDLILLEADLPGTSGREVLQAIRAAPQASHAPVVVLTNCAREETISEIYRLGCRPYVVKPLGFDAYCSLVGAFGAYLLSLLTLRTRHARQWLGVDGRGPD